MTLVRMEKNQLPQSEQQEAIRTLIVDDSPYVIKFLSELLKRNGYDCVTASNAEEAQTILKDQVFDLVLSDVNMPPGKSGIELIRDIKKDYPDTAVIMVSGEDDPETGALALKLGAFGYVVKPFKNSELLINISNAIIRRKLSLENKAHQSRLEKVVLERTKELMGAIQRLEMVEQSLRISQEETINRLAKAAEFRDNETAQHINRMSLYSELLAHQVGLNGERCELIRTASPMHDIGKIGITDRILLKPGKLTDEEFVIMKTHAEIGYRILSGSGSELLNLGAEIAWTHHEKYDGSGYPRGLTGEDIPLEGRIVAIADVFDALTSKRVYKPAFSIEEATGMMKENSGKHFDPYLLGLFMDSMPEVLEIKNQFPDD